MKASWKKIAYEAIADLSLDNNEGKDEGVRKLTMLIKQRQVEKIQT